MNEPEAGSADATPQDKGTPPDQATPSAPVLVSVAVLAGWLGLSPDHPDRQDSGPDADQHAEPGADTGAGPDTTTAPGFVPADPAPAAGSVRLLDVRWALGAGNRHEEYVRGHLPGAVYVNLETQLSGHGTPTAGRHPLPDPGRFGETVRMWGVDDGDTVVVYDDVQATSASRAWWLLRHAGLARVYLLDGGLPAWRAAGLPLQAGDVIPRVGTARTAWGRMPVVDTEAIAAADPAEVLLDARAPERYRGEHEPLDPQAGHIPGARNLPSTRNVSDDGRFLPAGRLREQVVRLGADGEHPVTVYCGSGIHAAHAVAALAVAGLDAALYPGSFSAWSNTPGLPVRTGEEP